MAQGEMAFFSRPSSSAVKIVAPSIDHPSSPKPSPKKGAHDRDEYSPVPPESPTPSAALPAQAVNAPVFVPKTSTTSDSPVISSALINSQMSMSSSSSAPTEYYSVQSDFYDTHDPYDAHVYGGHNGDMGSDGSHGHQGQIVSNPYADASQMLGYDGAMDPLYSTQFTFVRQPLNYHLYTQPRPDDLTERYFVTDNIREELQRRSEIIHTAPATGLNLPEEIQGYHTLVPLESIGGERRKFGNWYSTVYRASNSTDGLSYALRRIENFRLMQQAAFSGIEFWAAIRHPNIISVREAFTSRAFGDSSLVVVYDYHPNSQTLYDAHMKPKAPQFQNGRLQAQTSRIPEQIIWSYVTQIASAIKTVHEAGMAVRIIDATKVLLTGQNRVRISSCGVVDVLMYESRADIAYLQQEDLFMFAKLLLALCCSNLAAINNVQKAIETIGRHYSADLKAVALFLVTPAPNKAINQLFDMIGNRVPTEMIEMQNAVDRLESELMSELENARLVRLLCKFGFINERPEFAREPRWSETGDRYIIKLFRDYVFHQVDEQGNPVVNLSHVFTCLNKLDAGTDERIMLVARDEQSCLVWASSRGRSTPAAFSYNGLDSRRRVDGLIANLPLESQHSKSSQQRPHLSPSAGQRVLLSALQLPRRPMAAVYAQPVSALQSPRQQYLQPNGNPSPQRKHASRQKFAAEFSQCLFDFVIQLLPTSEEMTVKEDVRKLLERLIRTIEPDSRLLSFGSSANGFSLRNSDMDLCCLIDSEERLSATDLVNMLGDLLERETKFHVKPLPRARIPIVKLSLDPAPGLPFGIACDIGFENRLALENTRLLMCYAMIDPARVRTMVLFLKVWSKRRKINSPYKGTLSSYGYVLLVLYFLIHVKNPPVLPNLQQMPPLRPISEVIQLLDAEKGSPRERNRLCIEDPFETDFNVARCVTRDGLYTIRGEFMRASRILASRPERAIVALAQLCEERKSEELLHPSPSRGAFVPPRLSPLPPQVPYTVSSSPMRPTHLPVADDLSPQESPVVSPLTSSTAPSPSLVSVSDLETNVPIRLPIDQLEHMAPKRGKWTSPPPPEASEADHSSFEDRLGRSLALATVAGAGREHGPRSKAYASSSNTSEVHTDDEVRSDLMESDDAHSVRSFTEDGALSRRREKERDASREPTVTVERQQLKQARNDPPRYVLDPSSSRASLRAEAGLDAKMLARLRGRPVVRMAQQLSETNIGTNHPEVQDTFSSPLRVDSPRRSLSGPSRMSLPNRFTQLQLASYMSGPQYIIPGEALSPSHSSSYLGGSNSNVFYETSPAKDRLFRALQSYGITPAPSSSPQPRFDTSASHNQSSTLTASPSLSPRHLTSSPLIPSSRQTSPRHLSNSQRRNSKLAESLSNSPLHLDTSHIPFGVPYSHSHSHSITTATTPRAHMQGFSPLPPSLSRARTPPLVPSSRPHSRQQLPPRLSADRGIRSVSPFASVSSGSASPPMSCTSSQYAPSCSPLSTSPPSPSHSDIVPKISEHRSHAGTEVRGHGECVE
ncbi:uncharacterized protein FIBRA_05338 [Fibroporia radiculosa]|uniref:PAN2-PAN3 deadenylation complex subunit PAN3 n=1 Tax=Fibroporia radiculosa TaxID=599839 RepID=J4H3G1_9APHY|nr:uncharacterized protein FIBRA_05338 [Fibroporia radiculosa]CCM03214.1 predicted protein [Fibroporia radiculosa]